MSDTALQFPQWQEPLLCAIMETNHESLRRKIDIAKQAIHERMSESEPVPEAERAALLDALNTLRVLSEVLNKRDDGARLQLTFSFRAVSKDTPAEDTTPVFMPLYHLEVRGKLPDSSVNYDSSKSSTH